MGVNIAEGCPPSNVNNALRQAMADVATGINFSVLGTALASTSLSQFRTAIGVSGGSTSNNNFAALTNAANKVPYMTGSDNWSTTDLTSFARTLLAAGDATTAMTALSGVNIVAASISATSGYIKLNILGTTFTVQWVDGTAAGNATTVINYPTAFSSWSRAICGGGSTDAASEDNEPRVSSTSTTGASVSSSRAASHTVWIWAWGV